MHGNYKDWCSSSDNMGAAPGVPLSLWINNILGYEVDRSLFTDYIYIYKQRKETRTLQGVINK